MVSPTSRTTKSDVTMVGRQGATMEPEDASLDRQTLARRGRAAFGAGTM
jgi:hypothetical protein